MARDLPPEESGPALRRLASETRQQAAAARAQSRELAKERAVLLDALRQGWREQAGLLGQLTGSREALRDAVRAYALVLRREDMPPERMLIEVKQLVHETRLVRAPCPQEIMDQVVSWSIDAYYEDAVPR